MSGIHGKKSRKRVQSAKAGGGISENKGTERGGGMSEFDRFLKERYPMSDTYLREQMSFSVGDMQKSFAAGRAVYRAHIIKVKECSVGDCSIAINCNRCEAAISARIAELEADCKVMAEYIANGDHCLSINCACPACTIAGKYKEEIATWYAEEGWLLDEDDVAYAIRQRGEK